MGIYIPERNTGKNADIIEDLSKLAESLYSVFVVSEKGKGLSSNDYTTAEKNKVAEIDNKANATDIPTKTSDLTNDSNYATTEFVNSAITTQLGNIETILATINGN